VEPDVLIGLFCESTVQNPMRLARLWWDIEFHLSADFFIQRIPLQSRALGMAVRTVTSLQRAATSPTSVNSSRS
jgi:hypothetical protein